MKALIIYQSVHKGNTKKIAEVFTSQLKAKMVKPEEIKINDIGKYELIGFGSGIYFGKHHQTILDFVDKLPDRQDKKVFIFSTAGMPKLKFVWHFTLKNKLKNKGFKIIGEFTCAGLDEVGPLEKIGGVNKGRPNKQDLENARIFIDKITS